MDLRHRVLEFLHGWVNDNKINHIRKGMVEDLEHLIDSVAAESEVKRAADKMINYPEKQEPKKDPNPLKESDNA
jgi:hypothetical protein